MVEAGGARGEAALFRLLRRLSRDAGEGGASVPDGEEMAVTLDEACRRGLAQRTGDTVRLLPAARTFLRRVLADRDTAFSDQHGGRVQLEGRAGSAPRVNLAESPLSGLARLKDKAGAAYLPASAIAAGERLHRDFTRAGLQPRLTMTYAPRLETRTKGAAPTGAAQEEGAEAARRRLSRAIEAMGPELSGVAIDVCCFEKGLETVERERQWPARSAKLMLRAALMALARHYAPPGPERSGPKPRHWGAEDYRPAASGYGEGGG
ncbi:DUF6456 domain-containing protein [Ensifer soli]|uniref:DUF6456 domain-containing protein n=1 Tax=Ciceribacter sp. sgz301302 TaxID=3342379 RepID=UPI0035B6C0F0